MARTVKPEAFASKRREILDAVQRLVFSKGYEQMSIQDILDEVQISSGAFHHYFASRGALLTAFIERIKQETEKQLLPVIHNPRLTAIEKLQGFFDTLDSLRIAHKADVVRLGRVWYSDSNALVRQKVDEAVSKQRAPLLSEIVRQGIQEGVFSLASPERAGEVLLALLQGMGNRHAALLFSLGQESDDLHASIEAIVSTHAAYMEAIERVLGAPANSFARANSEAVNVWIAALRDDNQA